MDYKSTVQYQVSETSVWSCSSGQMSAAVIEQPHRVSVSLVLANYTLSLFCNEIIGKLNQHVEGGKTGILTVGIADFLFL